MNTLSILLTAFALSMDAFAVSLAKGMQAKKKLILIALSLAICFGFFQGLMPLIGYILANSFSKYIIQFDHWIAFGLLFILGINMILESKEEEDTTTKLNLGTILVLGVATSIDALAVGVSFAFLEVNIIQAIITIGIITFILSFLGVIIGHKLGNYLKKYAEIIGGLVLITIGLKILIEHLFF
ncbi:MAG: manganese efflux pump MntP family protein [Erysipelotrichaceae bacterium]